MSCSSLNNPFEVLWWSITGLAVVYLAARLITAAYFVSKAQAEERRKRNHG